MRGQRQRDQHGEREHGHRQRPARHEGAPARGEAGLAIGQVGVAAVAVPRRLDAAADLAQQRRHQRQRGGHREEHRQRGADGGTVEEGDPEQHHAEHRDHDDDAREQDGAAGRVDRDQRGLAHVTSGAAFEPEAVEDQQRVVDADADPDHRRQLRRPVDDVEHTGAHHRHQREAHDHREQGVEQRQPHRDHAERQEEHQGRHEDAEDLPGAALLSRRPVDDVPAERHLDPALAIERERVLGHRLDLRGVDVAGALAELDLGERDPAVLGDRCAACERIADGEHLG